MGFCLIDIRSFDESGVFREQKNANIFITLTFLSWNFVGEA